MMDENDLDALSISYLNALEYCPRRFYYECALSEFLDNAHVVEGTMRREEVAFTDVLRRHTEEAIELAFSLLARRVLPAPLVGKQSKHGQLPALHPKCKDCSLEPLCLPREVVAMGRAGTIQGGGKPS